MTSDRSIRSVAVFCGSRFGNNPAFRQAAADLGAGLARAGMRVVYGGGGVGLMGVVADAAITAGGSVLGVIPDFLRQREVAHPRVMELVVTDTMHDRKRQMFAAADAFVTMPGGIGTFDETVEITTWKQLELHEKPVLICNVLGWAQPYLAMVEAAVRDGFAGGATLDLYEVVPDVPAVLQRLSELSADGFSHPERV